MADVPGGAPVGVILAAGSGLRLARDSKPLTRVAGVTLLERAVWALRRAGVERVVAVVWHRGEEVRRFVAERALEDGAASWNDVKRRYLGEGGAITAVDLRGEFWIDVDTPGDLRRAERVLVRRAAAKPSDGVLSRRLNRPLSRSLSLLLVRTRISPNAISALTFLLTLGAAGLLALGRMNALVL